MQKFRNSTLTTHNGVDFLVLNENDYYSTGYAYGKLLSASKNKSIRLLRNPFLRLLVSMLYWFTKKHLSQIHVPKDYLNELRGYSEGAKISYNHLFFLNVVFDILKRYGFHCSTIAFFTSNSTLVGRNTDLVPFLTRIALRYAKSLVVQVSIPGKKTFTHVGIPFFVGAINGFNVDGIAVNSHQILSCSEKENKKLLSTPLLMRILLENVSCLEDAVFLVDENITRRSLNVMVTSEKERRSIIFEINPSKNCSFSSKKHYLCCTTHFQDPKMRLFHNGRIKASEERLLSMNNLVKDLDKLSVSEFTELLKDQTNGMAYHESGCSLTNKGTYQSFVFDLKEQKVYISNAVKKPVSLHGKYVMVGDND